MGSQLGDPSHRDRRANATRRCAQPLASYTMRKAGSNREPQKPLTGTSGDPRDRRECDAAPCAAARVVHNAPARFRIANPKTRSRPPAVTLALMGRPRGLAILEILAILASFWKPFRRERAIATQRRGRRPACWPCRVRPRSSVRCVVQPASAPFPMAGTGPDCRCAKAVVESVEATQ